MTGYQCGYCGALYPSKLAADYCCADYDETDRQ